MAWTLGEWGLDSDDCKIVLRVFCTVKIIIRFIQGKVYTGFSTNLWQPKLDKLLLQKCTINPLYTISCHGLFRLYSKYYLSLYTLTHLYLLFSTYKGTFYTVMVLSKLKKKNATAPQPQRTVLKYIAIFKNVTHSLEPGETPGYLASHQAPNYVQRS